MSDTLYPSNTFATNTEDEVRSLENVTNPYIDFMGTGTEQDLVRQQTAESIQKNGDEFIYIKRSFIDSNVDDILGEIAQANFNNGWKFVAYIDNVDDYLGEKDYYAEWGGGIDDQLELVVEPELFKYQVAVNQPASGDLIYWPRSKGLYELTWNEDDQPFYTNGVRTQWRISASSFIYSGEKVEVTSQVDGSGAYDPIESAILDDINNVDDKQDNFDAEHREGTKVQTESDDLISDIDESNPFGINV